MKKAHAQFSADYIKILLDIYNHSKKLSDYAKNINPEDEEFFENAKKEQLLKASSKDTEWLPIFERVEELGAVVSLFSYFSKKINPPSRKQIYFWAMQQAYNESLCLGMDTDITQQLEMDMIMAYLQFAVDGMDIAAETKLQLQTALDEIASQKETINAQGVLLRDRMNAKYPKRPPQKITQESAAESINRIFGRRGLLRINSRTNEPMPFSVRTIRRWESLDNPHPPWYTSGLRDLGKENFDDAVRKAATDIANKRGIRHPSKLYDNYSAPTDRDPSAIMDNAEREALIQKIVVLPTEDIAKMYELFEAAVQKVGRGQKTGQKTGQNQPKT